ncbi:hypothetical protein ACP26L_19150 [Paenibacillus sp. S-38]|uniref:hypothetical protein n=1 Tax=Paenibacillus sp. S-38 TaxID=3416710 RepID=UPI003CF63328
MDVPRNIPCKLGLLQEPITVNWKRLDNNKEAYPILRFRDILYFPMTWRFTHDEFEWTTEWDSGKGLRLTTVQHKVFYNVFYDEGDRLYASANESAVYSIDKGMKQTPVRLTREEAELVRKKAKEREQPHRLTISTSKKVEFREGRFYYGPVELQSLDRIARICIPGTTACTVSIKANPPDFEEAVVQVNDGLTLVYLYVELWPSEPGKRGLYRPASFLIKDGRAVQLEPITQFPDRMIQNPDGSLWFYSLVPEDTWDARTNKGQVWLVRPDGTVEELNSRLQADNVEVLKVQDGRMVVRSFNDLFGAGERKPSDGVYELDTRLGALKRAMSISREMYMWMKQARCFISTA